MADFLQTLIGTAVDSINRITKYPAEMVKGIGQAYVDRTKLVEQRGYTESRDLWELAVKKQEREEERLYNSPLEASKRLEAAGLNPLNFFGKQYESPMLDISANNPPPVPYDPARELPSRVPDILTGQQIATNELNNEMLNLRNELTEKQIDSQEIQNQILEWDKDIVTGKKIGVTSKNSDLYGLLLRLSEFMFKHKDTVNPIIETFFKESLPAKPFGTMTPTRTPTK